MAPKSHRFDKVAKSRFKSHPGLPGQKTLGLVDIFLFLLDSRIPATSLKLTEPYLRKQKRVYVLTKPDLADPGVTAQWLSWFGSNNLPAFSVKCDSGQGLKELLKFLRDKKFELDKKRKPRIQTRAIRLMLFGLPNVGKSSLGNRLLGIRKAPFGAKPGLTRGSHWLKGRGFLEILDTPGVIDTSLVEEETRCKLAVTWALPENAYDHEEVALWLAANVLGHRKDPLSFLNEFGTSRGFLIQGGRIDIVRASKTLIHEFRQGRLGRFSLEKPD